MRDWLSVHIAVCVEYMSRFTDSVYEFARVQISKLWCRAVSVVCFACLSNVRGVFVILGVVVFYFGTENEVLINKIYSSCDPRT